MEILVASVVALYLNCSLLQMVEPGAAEEMLYLRLELVLVEMPQRVFLINRRAQEAGRKVE
jgi:hypothetical protein